jgi:hypothetical protein
LSYAKDLYDAEAGAKQAKKNVSGTVTFVRRRSRWTKAARLSHLNIST